MPKVAALLAVPLLLSACSAVTPTEGEDGDELAVTTAFYPLHYATEQIAGEHADITLLTQTGGDPHDLELTVAQTAEVAGADLVVHLEEFQPAVDDAVTNSANGAVLDAADVVDLRAFGESDAEHDQHSAEHEHGDEDPHFWHDPLRMADLGDAVAEQLSELDPEHADEFRANAEDFRAEMSAIDEAYAEGLAQCERTTVVTSHDAFGYLSRYGLEFESIAGVSPEIEATPAHLAELQQLIREKGVTTVFTERLSPSAAGDSLAADLGLASETLDPIGGLDDETAEEDYASLMAANLEALRAANGCR